jgi:hypothetical protein
MALLAVSGIVLLTIVPAVSANALPTINRKVDTAKTWNMAGDFVANPKLNPAPDKYGDKGVWSWMYGSTNTPSSYRLDGYESPSALKAACGVKQYV